MILFEDTRNKIGKHNNVLTYCKENEIGIIRKKLDVGDYMLEGNDKISVDTKMSLTELAYDFGRDKSRFWREVRRAYRTGVKLYVLTETNNIKKIEDIANWKNPMSYVNKYILPAREVMERIYRCHISYGVEFVFCKRTETGQKIMEILTKNNKEKK